MKYCSRCGKQLFDEAVVCLNCGCATENPNLFKARQTSGLKTAAKVFMIIDTVFWGIFFLITLVWKLPMTIVYFNRTKNNIPVSTGFKVCSLLFGSLLGGIFMLCDSD